MKLKDTISVGLIGYGLIGKRLHEKVKAMGWTIAFIAKSNGILDGDNQPFPAPNDFLSVCLKSKPDVVFLAIPTKDDGEAELRLIGHCMHAGSKLVTCAKGARANFGHELTEYAGRIGDSATVGGGTMLAEYAKLRGLQNMTRLDAVLNGTLNFLWNQLSQGVSVGEAIEEARRKGIVEPGEEATMMSIVKGEGYGDVPRKIAVLCKKLRICDESVRAKSFKPPRFVDHELKQVIEEAENWRFIVSIRPSGTGPIEGIGICHESFPLHDVYYGWQKVEGNPFLQRLAGPDAYNTLSFEEGEDGLDGRYILQGPGAGAGATTAAMMNDAFRLLGI